MNKMQRKYRKISAYLDGELAPDQARQIEKWIETDNKARAWYMQCRRIDDQILQLDRTITDPYAMTRVRQAIAENAKGVKRYTWLRKVWISIPVVAGIITGMLIGVRVFQVMNMPMPYQNGNPAQQYFNQEVMPILPDDSISEKYVKILGGSL